MRLPFNYSQWSKTVFKTFGGFPKFVIDFLINLLSKVVDLLNTIPLFGIYFFYYFKNILKYLLQIIHLLGGAYLIIGSQHAQKLVHYRFWYISMPFIKFVASLGGNSIVKYAYNTFFTLIASNVAEAFKFNYFCEQIWLSIIIVWVIATLILAIVGYINKNTAQKVTSFFLFILVVIFYNIFTVDLYLDHSLANQFKLKETNKQYYDFQHSDAYRIFRYFVGRGEIYSWDQRTASIAVDRAFLSKVDPLNVLEIGGVPSDLRSIHCKMLALTKAQPSLDVVEQCMNNPAFYNSKFRDYPSVPPFDLFSLDTLFIFFSAIYNIVTQNHLGSSIIAIILVICCILTLLYLINFVTSISYKDNEKLSPYECGFDPIHTNARIKFDVLYWIIGILYQIFDLELIFIFPLATILHDLQNPIGLLVYLIFIIVLTLGFIYEWKKGALKLNL